MSEVRGGENRMLCMCVCVCVCVHVEVGELQRHADTRI